MHRLILVVLGRGEIDFGDAIARRQRALNVARLAGYVIRNAIALGRFVFADVL